MCSCSDARCPDCRMLSGACTCPAPTPCEAAHGRDTPPERPGGFRSHDRRPPVAISQCASCERLEAASEARDRWSHEVSRLAKRNEQLQRDLDLASACLDRLRTELAMGPKRGEPS